MGADRAGTDAQTTGHFLVALPQADPGQYLSFTISQHGGSFRGRLQPLTIGGRQDGINDDRIEVSLQRLIMQQRAARLEFGAG